MSLDDLPTFVCDHRRHRRLPPKPQSRAGTMWGGICKVGVARGCRVGSDAPDGPQISPKLEVAPIRIALPLAACAITVRLGHRLAAVNRLLADKAARRQPGTRQLKSQPSGFSFHPPNATAVAAVTFRFNKFGRFRFTVPRFREVIALAGCGRFTDPSYWYD